MTKNAILVGFVALLVGFSAPAAYASHSADDATADQGKGDVSITGTLKVNSANDDGTPDQGRGDFNADGTLQVTTGSDDGTPDQGRGDVSVTGAVQTSAEGAVGSGNDDGTADQGHGDVRTSASTNARAEVVADPNASIFVKVRTWFVSVFGWMHF